MGRLKLQKIESEMTLFMSTLDMEMHLLIKYVKHYIESIMTDARSYMERKNVRDCENMLAPMAKAIDVCLGLRKYLLSLVSPKTKGGASFEPCNQRTPNLEVDTQAVSISKGNTQQKHRQERKEQQQQRQQWVIQRQQEERLIQQQQQQQQQIQEKEEEEKEQQQPSTEYENTNSNTWSGRRARSDRGTKEPAHPRKGLLHRARKALGFKDKKRETLVEPSSWTTKSNNTNNSSSKISYGYSRPFIDDLQGSSNSIDHIYMSAVMFADSRGSDGESTLSYNDIYFEDESEDDKQSPSIELQPIDPNDYESVDGEDQEVSSLVTENPSESSGDMCPETCHVQSKGISRSRDPPPLPPSRQIYNNFIHFR